MFGGKFIKFGVTFFLILSFFMNSNVERVQAATLSAAAVSLANDAPITSTTYTVSFTLATTQKMKMVKVVFYKNPSDTMKPNSMIFSSAVPGDILGLNSNWSIDLTQSSTGMILLQNSETDPTELSLGASASFTVGGIQNPELGECSVMAMSDTCSYKIETYDKDSNMIDNSVGTFTIQEDPVLEFTVTGVASGITTNGITTNIASTYDGFPFGHIDMMDIKYAAQKLKVVSNTPYGYEVQMKLNGYMQGLVPSNKIDPFAATDSSWATPKSWDTPYGYTPNSDTGWIGANTSDARVSGWSNSSGKFGPVSSTKHTVMKATGRDTGTEAYVTYGLQVNQYQPPDSYAGEILYFVLATY